VLKARDTYEIMRAEDVGWSANQHRAGQALRPQRLQAAAAGAGHRARSPRPRSTPPSRASRTWPTARRRSSTRTSSRSCSDESVTPQARALPAAVAAQRSRRPASARTPSVTLPPAAQELERRERTATGRWTPALQGHRDRRCTSGAELLLYSVNAITSGSTESQGEVTVRLQHGRPGRQRRRGRPGHRRRLGQGLPWPAEQAAQQGRARGRQGLTLHREPRVHPEVGRHLRNASSS
jgi:2-isopropylmalate synthase